MITTRKLKLIVDSNDKDYIKYVKKFIRDEQYQQYLALNLGMSLIHTHSILETFGSGAEARLNAQLEKLDKEINKVTLSLEKVEEKLLKDLSEKATIKANLDIDKFTKKIKQYQKDKEKLLLDFEFAKQYRSNIDSDFKEMYIKDIYTILQNKVNLQNKDNMSLITQKLRKDYIAARKNGLARGDRSLTSYKRTNSLLTRGRDLTFYYNDKNEVCIKWIKNIYFKVLLGRKDKDYREVSHTINEIITNKKNYKICDSKIIVDSKNRVILSLSIDINVKEKRIESDKVVGVDLGLNIPAYVSLNNDSYKRKAIGSKNDFLRVRTQMQERRRQLYKSLSLVKGGKGRADKLKAINKLKEKERNFTKTYNHMLSKEIVKFAKDNNAGQINLELLSLKNTIANDLTREEKRNKEIEDKKFILRNWSYYELQQMIEYKAEREGIVIKYVDPYLTSQTCSRCGNIDKNNRKTQSDFICTACGFKANADFNASQVIAKSDRYITEASESEYVRLKEKENKDEDIALTIEPNMTDKEL